MMQDSSSTSNSKKGRRKFFAVLSPIIFIILVLLCNQLLRYILVDDTNSYTRVTLHEMYSQEENIDVLFLGSSHCYRSFDTMVTDQEFNANTFNLGTSSQSFDGSYALLKEANKDNEIKKVYVETYYVLAGETYEDRIQMTATYIISDYMKPSVNKYSYLINASGCEQYINSFFLERRNWDKLFDPHYMASLILKKQSDSYKNYDWIGTPEVDQEYYAGKGYVANVGEIKDGNYSQEGAFDSTVAQKFSKDDKESLEKIISYCEKNDIELVFFSAPMPDFRLVGAGDYDKYITEVKDFLSKYDVPYYDFNLCKEEYFSFDDENFMDTDHLNADGAAKFSKLVADLDKGNIKAKDLFYDTYREKVEARGDKFYGLTYDIEEKGETKTISFEAVMEGDFSYRASVFKKVEGSENYVEIQSQGTLGEITLPKDEKGTLLVNVYSSSSSSPTNKITIEY